MRLTLVYLFSISDDPANLSAIKTLAGMGILSNDESLLDAAVSEIVGLPLDQRQLLDRERNVDGLLERYHLSRVSFFLKPILGSTC